MKTETPQPPGVFTRTEAVIPVLDLLAIRPPDINDGWRIIYTKGAKNSMSKEYRTAHARAQRIRSGKVSYLADYGQWEARVQWINRVEVALFVRYCGPDGKRWEWVKPS